MITWAWVLIPLLPGQLQRYFFFKKKKLLLFVFSLLRRYNDLILYQAAQEHGMGPRGSALICGYTNYHRLLESSLADLKKKEVWASMALMPSVSSVIYNCCYKTIQPLYRYDYYIIGKNKNGLSSYTLYENNSGMIKLINRYHLQFQVMGFSSCYVDL
jgi:hypothetical protein